MTREENPEEKHDGLPYWPMAAVSAALILVLYTCYRLGAWDTTLVLLVPTLTALLMFPAYLAARRAPDRVCAILGVEGVHRRLERVWSLAIVTGLLLTVWIAFGDALQSQWGIKDDHEIMFFLGGDGRLTLREIPSLLMQTEVGAWGAYARYRPAYYFLRLVETAAWGMHPTLWYACSVALVGLAIVIWWRLVSGSLGKLGAGLLCMYALTFPYWNDLVGRLGPSETYVVLGLPVYIAGMSAALRDDSKSPTAKALAYGAILVGSVVCFGSKENLLLLALPTGYLLVRAVLRRDYPLLGVCVLGLLFAAFVGGSVLVSVSRTGVDVYDDPVALGPKLAEIVSGLRDRRFVTPFSILVAVTGAVGGLYLMPRWTPLKRSSIRRTTFWLSVLCLVYVSQLVFYGAEWPVTETRYGFPGLLYYPASILILHGLAQDLLAGYTTEGAAQYALRASLCASLVVVIIYHEGYAGAIRAMQANVASTREFTSRLERLATQLKQDESLQLVVESSDVWDYEPVFGYPRFLRAYQVANPMLLRLNGYGSGSFSAGLEQRLAAELEAISSDGGSGYLPLSSLEEQPERCLSLFLSAEYSTGCEAF